MEKGISMTDNVFSLLDEHWIPVSYLDGHPAEISLREIFLDAPKIKELSGDIPQQKLPLMRFLLAIMYRAYCIDGADEEQMRELWEGIYSSGQFNEDALDYYFDEWADRFFLLGERPFFQVPGLQYVGSKPYSPVSEMIADVPKPDKYLFSMRDLRAADSLCRQKPLDGWCSYRRTILRESKPRWRVTPMSIRERSMRPKECWERVGLAALVVYMRKGGTFSRR